MRHLTRTIASRIRGFAGTDTESVHFHQGPQGQPAPCFDERCASPRLSV